MVYLTLRFGDLDAGDDVVVDERESAMAEESDETGMESAHRHWIKESASTSTSDNE